MEERLYSLNDANFNTTALVTSGGVVAERFLYDPYGQVTTANGTPATPSADNAWIYLHQGGRWDSATGMYNFRNRDFSPTLMRWATNDPIGFGGGDTNTYRYVGNGPGNRVDPSGLEKHNKRIPDREENHLGPRGKSPDLKDISSFVPSSQRLLSKSEGDLNERTVRDTIVVTNQLQKKR